MKALKLPKFIVAGFFISSCSWDHEGEDAEEKRRLKDANIDEIHDWNDLD